MRTYFLPMRKRPMRSSGWSAPIVHFRFKYAWRWFSGSFSMA